MECGLLKLKLVSGFPQHDKGLLSYSRVEEEWSGVKRI
jgi:hypothetical protein